MSKRVNAAAAAALIALLLAALPSPAGAALSPTAITPMVEPDAPQNYSMDAEPTYTNGTSNTVSWQPGDDPSGSTPLEYYVQVSRQLGFGTIEMNSGWISGNSTTFAGLQDGILYYFRVRARDSLGNVGGYSAPAASTQDDAPPSAPILGVEPAFTAGTSNTAAWGASVDAGTGGVQYYAEASTSSTFATLFASSGWIGGTSYAFSSLTSTTTYYIHVKARDGFGHESAWSDVEFSTQDGDAPSTPVMNAEPAFTVGTSNAVSWAASTDAGVGGVQYQVDYSASSTFASGVVTSAWQSSTSFTASPLTSGTQYYFRVRARDAFAQASPNSGIETSTQDNTAPTTPAITAEPAFSAGTINSIFWGAALDAGLGPVQYLAQLSASSTFSTIDQSVGWTGNLFATFGSLTDGTTFYYRVKARDGFGRESAFSSVTSSTQDNSAPPIPALAAEPAFTQGLANTVSWAAVVDAGSGGVTYEVQSATNAAFTAGLTTSGFQSATSFTFGGLLNGQAYFYRTRARDAIGFTSAFSASQTTTIDNAAPPVPTLAAEPAFTIGTTNAVAWGAVVDAGAGGVQYWVESSRGAAFTVIDDDSGWTGALSFTFTRLDDGVRYFFHIKSRDGLAQESAFSAAVSSVQDASPPPVPTMTPLAAISSGTFQLPTWGAVTDAGSGSVQYWAEYSTAPSFSPVSANSGWTASTFWSIGGLSDATTYYYHVKSRDALLQESAFSTAVFSRQDNAAPTNPVMVAEPAFTAGTSNTLSWTTSTDAGIGGVVYDLQYATNAAFSAGVTNVLGLTSTSTTVSALNGGTTYFWHVRARDAFAIATAFSPAVSSTQDNAAPPVPTLAAEPAFTIGTTNAVAWGAVVDAGAGGVQYWVESSRGAAFTVIDDDSGWISALSFTFTRLDDGVRYFFHIKSRDGLAQESAFSAAVSSVQDASPPPVPTMTPLAAISSGTFQFPTWGAVTDAGSGSVQYWAEYSTAPSFAPVSANSGWTASTFWFIGGLSDATTYYYHVKSRDALLQESAFSTAVFSRQDNAAPTNPVMVAEPAFTAGTSNTLSWTTSTDAGIGGVVYDLQYATNAAFSAGVTNVLGLTSTSTTVSALNSGTTYFWHVRARDAFGIATAFSATVSSTQDNAAPPAPVMAGEPGFTAGTSNTVSWSAVTDAGVGGVQYNVQASRGATFTVIESSSGWIASTSFTFTRLDDGAQFYYRVQARDAFDFQGAFSGTVTSTQDNAPPTVPVLAAEPTFTAGTTNTVSWGASTDAGVSGVTYQFQYSNTAAFTGAGTVLVSPAASPATASPLANGVTYYLRVRATDSFGFTSAWSNVEHSTQDAAGPPAPAMLGEPSFTQGSSNTVSWTSVLDTGIGGVQYWCEYASSSTFSTVLGNSGWTSGNSATFFALSDGTRFYFRAKARDAFLQESSFSSSENSQQDASAPSTPTTVALPTYTQGNTVTVVWASSSDSGAGGVEYEAQYAGPGFSPLLGTSGWSGSTTFTFAGLADGVTYAFRVRARDSLANTGPFSTVRTTTMDASAPTVPLQFTQTEFTPGTSNTIGWAASTDAGIGSIQYQVQYSIFSTFPGLGSVTTAWGVTSIYTVNGLIDGFTYYYRIRARDGFQQTSAWSLTEQSTQDNSPPAVPVTMGLPTFIDGSSTTFGWNEAVDAGVGGVEYQAQVARDPSFSVVVATSSFGPGTTHTFTGLTDATVFYYRVRARDAFFFTSNWSGAQAAMTDFMPPPVPALSPLPAYSKGLSALLAWSSVNDAGVGGVTYEVRAFATTDTSTPFAATPWTSATQQLVGGLPEGSLVYFAVRARDAMGHMSPLSPLVSTRPDNSPPPTPTLAALPAYTGGLVVTAVWGAVLDAGVGGVVYRAQVSADPSFATAVYDSGWVTALSFSPPSLMSGTQYFARVKAADAFQFESSWSSPERTIVDNDSPGQPLLQALALFTSGSAVTVEWQGVVDAGVGGVVYDAQVSTATDFAVISAESGWVSANAWTFSALADGTRFYFRLLARDAFLHNATPSVSVFTTMDASAPPTPELLVMAAFTAGLQQSVGWNTVLDLGVGGVEYLVETSTNASFAGGGASSGWTTASGHTFAGLSDGTRFFYRVRARDSFDHLSNWSTVRNATMDNSPPSVTMEDSEVLMDVDSTDLAGAALDAVSGVFSVLFSTDGGATWVTATGTAAFVAPVSGLEEGKTTVLVRALDLVGHASALARVEITVDQSAPTVAFQAPANGSIVTGLLGIYAVVDDSNFGSFRLQERRVGTSNFTDLVSNGTTARGDNFLGLWDTRVLQNGMYELRLTARDALGHTTQRTIQVRLLNSDLSVSYGDIVVSNRQPLRGEIVNVSAIVNNYGTAAAENVTITLKDNGIAVFNRSGVTIGAHAAFGVDVPYNLSTAGAHAFTLEVSYPEGVSDTGLSTSTAVVAAEPPVPEPKPFLVEFAGLFSLLSLVALAAIAAWAFVQIGRLKRQGVAGPAYGAIPEEAVDVEWESDEFL